MNPELERAYRVLRFREVIRLEDAAGTRLQVVRGSVWITQEGDRRDYYLTATGTLTLDRPGLALIHALEPALLVVRRPAPQTSLSAQVARGLARASRALTGWVAHRFGPAAIENQGLPTWHRAL
ncbi:MAG TPA: DUF2917 domain-containing protein [Burkholderiales bacterium]